MLLPRIFKIFFSVGIILLLTELRGEIYLGSRAVLEREFSGGEDAEFLRSALQRIDQVGRMADKKRHKKQLYFRLNAAKFELLSSKRQYIVALPGCAKEWKRSFEQRQMVFGALFRLRFELGLERFSEMRKLPAWLCCAVEEAMMQRQESEQYLSGNKDFLVLQTIVRKCGKLPDFAALCRFETPPSDPASRRLFSQMSRLLMEVAAKNNLLQPMLENYYQKLSADHWVSRFANAGEAQSQVSEWAAKILWNYRSPQPAALLVKQIEPLQSILLPELDKKGVPSGEMMKLSFAEANALFMNSRRPDIEEVRNYYARQWYFAGLRQTAAVKNLCRKLGGCAGKLGESEEIPKNFATLIRELNARLDMEERIVAGFHRHCFKLLPLDQLYFWQERAVSRPEDDAASEQIRALLEKTEKEYLKNY